MNKPHYKHTPKGPVIQNRYDAEPNPARRFELLADMSRVLDAVIYAVRQAQK